jgi:formylglycine-generating enzyme required for sulfatase activity
MLGTVHDWCRDWHAPWYYAGSPPENPLGPSTGSDRVIRVGEFSDGGQYARSHNRAYFHPTFRFFHTGFRVIREL